MAATAHRRFVAFRVDVRGGCKPGENPRSPHTQTATQPRNPQKPSILDGSNFNGNRDRMDIAQNVCNECLFALQ